MRADALGLFWEDLPKLPKGPKEDEKYLPPPATWTRPDYLPFLQEAMLFDIPLMTDDDLLAAWRAQHELVFDIECYINYFLIAFKDKITGKSIYFERINEGDWNQDPRKFMWIMLNMTVKGFNSNNYDMAIAALALANKSNYQMKAATNMIIGEGYKPWQVLRKLRIKKLDSDHIDIIEVAPLSGSLKIYGGRANTRKMQDLPIHPEVELSDSQIAVTRYYCINDLDTTIDLDNEIQKDLKLREQMSEEYGIDLRSKSDAQIAEAVISHEIEKITGRKPVKPNIEPGTAYRYNIPVWMSFRSPLMQNVLNIVRNTVFVVSEKGSIGMPPELASLKINMGASIYKMGIGGLHSTEKGATHFSDELYQLEDDDVESYYPRIILNLGLYPQHLGRVFLEVYNTIVERRLHAKHTGDKDTANSLKIVINGSFGKLGSKYSIFYSPDLLIQTTLTGQLALLMLIEMLELEGIPVVSANTDGIVSKCPRRLMGRRDEILQEWQDITAFKLEGNEYKALCSKDVNNYFAVKNDGQVKAKGTYSEPGLRKNPTAPLCARAVEAFLGKGILVEETIRNCTDISQFISVRSVSGGAVQVTYQQHEEVVAMEVMEAQLRATGWVTYMGDHNWIKQEWVDEGKPYEKMGVPMNTAFGTSKWEPIEHEYLGKAIRWYYAHVEEGQHRRFIYAKNGNKVPKTDGAKQLMEMDGSIPKDLDFDWYIDEAKRILKDVGYPL